MSLWKGFEAGAAAGVMLILARDGSGWGVCGLEDGVGEEAADSDSGALFSSGFDEDGAAEPNFANRLARILKSVSRMHHGCFAQAASSPVPSSPCPERYLPSTTVVVVRSDPY